MRTWTEKLNVEKKIKVVRLEKNFTDIPEGSKMLVATPLIVDAYVRGAVVACAQNASVEVDCLCLHCAGFHHLCHCP